MDERKAWLVMVGALAFSMAIYVVVGWFVVGGRPRPGESDLPTSPASAVAAVLVLGAAGVLARAAAGLLGVAAFVVPAGNAYFRQRESRASVAPPLGPS